MLILQPVKLRQSSVWLCNTELSLNRYAEHYHEIQEDKLQVQ